MTMHSDDPMHAIPRAGLNGVKAYAAVTALVLLVMMAVGLVMRLAQGEVIAVDQVLFYRLLTAHGVGMVGIAGLGGASIMWYFVRRHVAASSAVLWINLGLFLVGVAMILAAILLGGFAGAWTFLYPLPAMGKGLWGSGAAALFLAGLLVVGTGFLILHLDVGRAIIARYGSLGRALGWPQLFGKDDGQAPPAAVVASTMVTIVNVLGITAGAAILVMSLVNLYAPAFAVDALLAKNLIYFFGHVFINATIYMAVIAVYEVLPQYAERPWRPNKVFLAAWTASTIMVVIVYPHHLLMDFVQPQWMAVVGQVISYTSGLPVLVVTGYGALTLVYRSGIRWDVTSGLLFLATFGWAAGVVPAVVDAVIHVNTVMHNTLWVPGHFHFYLVLGVTGMVFGFLYHLGKAGRRGGDAWLDRLAFWSFLVGTLGFVTLFLYSGAESVPRRYAAHLEQWLPYDRIASAFGAVLVAGVLVFVLRFLLRLRTAGPATA